MSRTRELSSVFPVLVAAAYGANKSSPLQINVALGVGVSLSKSTAVQFAGGFLVQVRVVSSLIILQRKVLTTVKVFYPSDMSGTRVMKVVGSISVF